MRLFTIAMIAFTSWPAAVEGQENTMLELHTRRRIGDAGTPTGSTRTEARTVRWNPKRTALVICDMWDRHWCRGAEARVGELAVPMNEMIRQARERGILIVHAPSTCVNFYKDSPERKLAQSAPFAPTPVPLSTIERWGTFWCYPDDKREGLLPIDDTDMGCDCSVKCKIEPPWKRQIATIDIRPGDAITDNGQEIWNLMQSRGIDHAIIGGVHLNMCVLGRPFAIRQLVYLGKDVVLLRDMTDTMYNHEMAPKVDHFTGTDLVVAHVERYWCPSIESTDLTGRPPFRFKEDRRPASDLSR